MFVWELEDDGAGAEHDEGEGGVGGVEAVAATDDEPDSGVEAFNTAGDGVLDGVRDEVAAF
ncbi:MAG: hypothetical protein ACE5GB_04240 [Acidimicrobiales bacterium]